jgi:exonuclease SbcC
MMVSVEQRATLNQQTLDMTNEQVALSALISDTTQQRDAQRDRQVTTESVDSLQQTEARLDDELKQLREAASRIRGQLDAQRQLKSRQQESLLALETQRSVCERWNNLHLLIGSADGKKFRNFAQGLTFERMVALANLQLRKLTDRYLLFHDNTQPLELQVVDSYQADQVRSTRNLSGGESFLVSLALALGLSHMASRNVRVDSMFLDEGFGSLDEDTLQTALDTLSSLQQEGKLIGVISHIAALKEQIRTQIQVEPLTEGRSALIGPGCRLL